MNNLFNFTVLPIATMLAAEQLDVLPGFENISAVAVLGCLMWFILNKVCKRLDDIIKEFDELKEEVKASVETQQTATTKRAK